MKTLKAALIDGDFAVTAEVAPLKRIEILEISGLEN
jgi:hypothetical protein